MSSSNRTVHISKIGPTIDVATPGTSKLYMLGGVWIILMILALAMLTGLIFEMLGRDWASIKANGHVYLLVPPICGLFAWFTLGCAVQRFNAASTARFLRVGPGGISISLPVISNATAFYFQNRKLRVELSWDRIEKWFPYIHKINSVTRTRAIIFKTYNNEFIEIPAYHFSEDLEAIVANISRASKMMLNVENRGGKGN